MPRPAPLHALLGLSLLLLLPASVRAQGEPGGQETLNQARAETLRLAQQRYSTAEVAQLKAVIRYAEWAHRGQLRDGGRPAILHPLRVTRSLLKLPASDRVPLAAVKATVLHDVVEDTSRPLREIRARFGAEVASLVNWVTLDPLERFKNDKQARDRAYYTRFRKAPRGAHLIKLHDRLDNVRDMKGWGLEGKLGYLQATRDKVIASLKPRSPDLARTLEGEVSKLVRRFQAEQSSQERKLAKYRRPDKTLRWKQVVAERALHEGAGLARFTLALFLKELAVVVRTGDELRIEEFFEGIATTDFFVHYGLFSVGARAGEVAYARYLQRAIKPRFVSGLLKTQVSLAAGLALPQLLRGQLEGKAFALSLTSLGLSSTAVSAGLQGLRWASGRSGASALARGWKLTKLASLGGWVYRVAETALVLTLAEGIERRLQGILDERAARAALASAGQTFFAEVAGARAEAEPARASARLQRALDTYQEGWDAYRASLYRPVLAEELRLKTRLNKLARKAKLLADERQALRTRLTRVPALAARARLQHGSLEAYVASYGREREAEFEHDAERALGAYQRAVNAGLAALEASPRRPGPYLGGLDAREQAWLLSGLNEEAHAAPSAGRQDLFARAGRGWTRRRVLGGLGEASAHPGQTLDDALRALGLAEQSLAGKPALQAQVRGAAKSWAEARRLQRKRGVAGALSQDK